MRNEVSKLLNEFRGPIKWLDRSVKGFPASWKGWFRIEISPLPSFPERELVAADICNTRGVAISAGGRLRHDQGCSLSSHVLSGVAKPSHIKRILKNIPEVTFKVALFVGKPDILNGQPVAIIIDPPISYVEFPNHPHINTGGPIGIGCYLPDSICYTEEPEKLGSSEEDGRLIEAVDHISMWLFRHQIWLASGDWIGPHKPYFEPSKYAFYLNPLGSCRCGQKNKYKDCCMIKDVMEARRCSYEESLKIILLHVSSNAWQHQIGNPQSQALQLLREDLFETDE